MLRHHYILLAVAVPLFCAPFFCTPSPAWALNGICKRADESSTGSRTHSLRDKASRFAPQLNVRIWFEPSDSHESRQQAQTDLNQTHLNQTSTLTPAVTPAPRPIRRQARVSQPYGWQVSVRWDLVEMAEAVRPSLAGSTIRPTLTECLDNQTTARKLLLPDELNRGDPK
jgi:hypothetical protein